RAGPAARRDVGRAAPAVRPADHPQPLGGAGAPAGLSPTAAGAAAGGSVVGPARMDDGVGHGGLPGGVPSGLGAAPRQDGDGLARGAGLRRRPRLPGGRVERLPAGGDAFGAIDGGPGGGVIARLRVVYT